MSSWPRRLGLLAAAVLGLLAPAAAQGSPGEPDVRAATSSERPKNLRGAAGGLQYDFHGQYRLLGWSQSDIALGARDFGETPDFLGQTGFVEHRLRLGGAFRYRDFDFDLEVDVLSGLLNAPAAGIVQHLPTPRGSLPRGDVADPLRNQPFGVDLNSFAVRKAFLTWRTPIGHVGFGPTAFTWGLGMLANDGGARLDDAYADQRFGDRTVRAMFATKPLYYLTGGQILEDITAVVGADFLLQDETGRFFRSDAFSGGAPLQDTGVSGILVLKHSRGNYNSGVFVARRQLYFPARAQPDAYLAEFATDLEAWAFDFFLDYKRPALGGEFYGAFEGVWVTGSTNHVRNNACLGNDATSRCKVEQQGALARLGFQGETVSYDLLGGYASGDGNPFDDTVKNFRMDRDFKVGLILFDQVLAWQSAGAVRRASDPTVTNGQSAGVELLSTSGAITNALFLQPTVRVKLSPKTTFRTSFLWARAPQRYSDAFWVNRESAKTNPFGAPAGSNYGVEVNAGVDYRRAVSGTADFVLGVHGGYFIPGNAFELPDAVDGFRRMDPVWLVKARTGFVF